MSRSIRHVLCLLISLHLPWLAPSAVATVHPLITPHHSLKQLYVATYTSSTSQGIYHFWFDERTGELSHPKLVADTENPSWMVMNRAQTALYTVSENGPLSSLDTVGRVKAFRVHPGGTLTQINSTNTLGDEPTHATLSPDERYLLVSNYAVKAEPGGMLSVISLRDNHFLNPVSQVFTHTGSKVNLGRQLGAHVHSAIYAPDHRYVFVCDLGADRIYSYFYDPGANPERPLFPSPAPYTQLQPGSGPRHLVFGADGKHAYVTLELTGEVAMLDYVKGNLLVRQTLSLADPDWTGTPSASALRISPDGRFLYATNRGSFNHIVVMAIDPLTGELTVIQRRPVEGKEPREFNFDPAGRYVLITNQLSNQIVVIARDAVTGKLGDTMSKTTVPLPTQLLFLDDSNLSPLEIITKVPLIRQ